MPIPAERADFGRVRRRAFRTRRHRRADELVVVGRWSNGDEVVDARAAAALAAIGDAHSAIRVVPARAHGVRPDVDRNARSSLTRGDEIRIRAGHALAWRAHRAEPSRVLRGFFGIHRGHVFELRNAAETASRPWNECAVARLFAAPHVRNAGSAARHAAARAARRAAARAARCAPTRTTRRATARANVIVFAVRHRAPSTRS